MKRIKLALHWQILIGICLGVLFGIFCSSWSPYVKWIGDIFLRAIKMVVIPVVFTALIMGVSSLGKAADLGRIAIKTLSYYVVTTLIACVIGLCLVNLVKPGVGADLNLTEDVSNFSANRVSFIDQIVAIVPDNIFQAMASGNMLPVIFFALFFGLCINLSSDKSRTVLTNFFEALYEVVMKLTFMVIQCAPIGLFGVIAGMIGKQVAEGQALGSLFGSLGVYTAVVAAGCLLQMFVALPALMAAVTKLHPFRFMKQMTTALLTVFSTASSAAALPIALRDIQEKTGVSRKIAGFCLPLGNTINMNGTALYECVTAIFIAQVYGIDLTIGQEIMIVLSSLLAAIGTAGIPMAGLVMLAVVLGVAGLPLEGIGLVLVVQQPLDMIRSTVNVFGDMCATVIVAKTEKENLTI